MTRNKWATKTALIVGIAGSGAAVAVSAGADANSVSTSPPPSTAPVPSLLVRARQVAADSPALEQTYTGVVRARYETDLAFRVGAKIASRQVEIGQKVKAGAVLFRLDPTDFRLAVKAAEADLIATEADVAQSNAEYERQAQSHRSGAGSKSDLDRAHSSRDVATGRRDRARESLTLARNRLSYCDLTADADGVILSLAAEAGQVVAEGQIVARLARDGEREAVVSLPENQIALAASARARVSLWSSSGQHYPAALRELSPIADPVTRTYQARFTIRNADPKVVLGMTAAVHLAPAERLTGFVLPLSSLTRTGDRPAVWIVERSTGALTLTPVTVLDYRHDSVVLGSGVKPGQWVVTAGVQKLDANMTVRIWEGN